MSSLILKYKMEMQMSNLQKQPTTEFFTASVFNLQGLLHHC